MENDSAVDNDIVSHVSKQNDISEAELIDVLTRAGGPTTESEQQSASSCYELQQLRNSYGEQLKKAAETDELQLLDSDGCVFWVDTYDGFGAYIHAGDGDSYYLSLSQLAEFTVVEAS